MEDLHILFVPICEREVNKSNTVVEYDNFSNPKVVSLLIIGGSMQWSVLLIGHVDT